MSDHINQNDVNKNITKGSSSSEIPPIEVIGPGMWITIHLKARKATNELDKRCFQSDINNLAEEFPCAKCKPHFQQYLIDNPLTEYWDIKDSKGDDVGFFTWTWKFHNSVNARLNKAIVPYEVAYNMFYLNFACHSVGCKPDASSGTSPIMSESNTINNIKPSNNRYVPRK